MEHLRPHARGASPAFLVVVLLLALLAAWLGRRFRHARDRKQVDEFAAGRGWEILSFRPEPFGPGWIGGEHSRVYAVEYRGPDGRTRVAHAKISTFAGVTITSDEERA